MALLLATLLSLSAAASAAGSESQNQITWASVVFTYHGDKVPSRHDPPHSLTPLGADQLLQAGQAIRSRYINPPSNGSQATGANPINGISVDAINNDQMEILSTDDDYVSASAQAFMQGLYPPRGTTSPSVDEESILGNGSLLQFPLGGYQYPNIQTLGSPDFNYIGLAGNIECTNYSLNEAAILSTSGFTSQIGANDGFYQGLANSVFWNLDPSTVNYANAENLYEYALYEYNHNKTVADSLSAADLNQLHSLASAQQQTFNTANGENTIGTIAGRTLANKVFHQLSENIATTGDSDKLTLLFGSFEPFLSFFGISGLSTGPSASIFKTIPDHGSLMAFELFSYSPNAAGQNLSTPYPGTPDLWVRFLFRNGTDANAPMIAYPLFDAGNSQTDMTWTDFASGIEKFGLNDVQDWCTACQTANLFCQALEGDFDITISNANHGSSISPAIAGVIGATVTLASFIVLSAALCLLGFRIDHREKKQKGKNGDLAVLRGSGGFKGAEKLASDTDLAIKNKAGASVIRHERVGSWELKDGPTTPGSLPSLDKEIESGRRLSIGKPDYNRRSEDGIGNVNPFGEPVSPLDQV